MRRVGVRLLADRSEVVNARLCRQQGDDAPSGGDMDSLPIQFCLSRGRWIIESQVLMKRRPRMHFFGRTNESCSGSSGLAILEMGSVAGGLSHKKDGIKQRKFKAPVPEVDVAAKGPRGY
jgi:hypothetical protein